MPTWLVPGYAFETLLILSGMTKGARVDELRALVSPAPNGNQFDSMVARGWTTLDGEWKPQRRYRITKLGREALRFAVAERDARRTKR